MRTEGHSAHPLPSREALGHNRNKGVRLLLVGGGWPAAALARSSWKELADSTLPARLCGRRGEGAKKSCTAACLLVCLPGLPAMLT